MHSDNPFGAEIDDDGLPKYSPDRKNIAAFHMYKLGMTDKLPDPEETHTPFFRTPSYYAEKEKQERQSEAGLIPKMEIEPIKPTVPGIPDRPETPDFFKKHPFDVDGSGLEKKGATPSLPVKLESSLPDTGNGQAGQIGQKEQGGMVDSSDGLSFGQRVMKHIAGTIQPVDPDRGLGKGFQSPPLSGSGVTGEPVPKQPESGLTGDSLPKQARTEQGVLPEMMNVPDGFAVKSQETDRGMTENPFAKMDNAGGDKQRADMQAYLSGMAEDASNNIHKLLYVPDNKEEDKGLGKSPGYRTAEWIPERRDQEKNPWTSGLFPMLFFPPEQIGQARLSSLAMETAGLHATEPVVSQNISVQNTAQAMKEDAPGWVNPNGSVTGNQPGAGVTEEGDFSPDDLEAPSAGRPANKVFRSVFKQGNPDNPDFAPAKIAFVDMSEYRIMKGRYLVSEEMAYGINRDLTEINKGYPIGINFRFVSAVEGGSGHNANIPLNRSDAENNRNLKNRSGVTVGSGFDLGQLAKGAAGEATLREYGFPESLVQKLSPYLGKKRLEAFRELDKRPLVLSNSELDLINRQVMTRYGNKCIVQWDSAVEQRRKDGTNMPYFHELTSNQQTIIFSRYYHQGAGWREKNREIYGSMVKNDWEAVRGQLKGLVDQLKESGPEWLHTRFNNEYDFAWPKKIR